MINFLMGCISSSGEGGRRLPSPGASAGSTKSFLALVHTFMRGRDMVNLDNNIIMLSIYNIFNIIQDFNDYMKEKILPMSLRKRL
jgi:hypothetical protein